ncbi:hypothetical protein LBMAG37_10410 [Anaerolineae bacterium]|nr:hypothetical protein LBMAG37_10410 [Anaerolineae bacterium]
MFRRWYLHVVSGITLQAVTWAVIGLLRGLLAGAGGALPQSTSLQLSVVLIGLPIFGMHWRWAQREASDPELGQRNEARPVYVHVMLLAFAVPWLFSAYWLIEAALQQLPNASRASFVVDATAGESVVALLVLAGMLWYFNAQRLDLAARFADEVFFRGVQRLAALLLAFFSLSVVLSNAASLLGWLLFELSPQPSGMMIAALPRTEVAALLTGMGAWLLAWRFAQRLFAGGAVVELQSVVRKLYLYVLLFAGMFTTVTNLALVLGGALRVLLGLPAAGDWQPLAAAVTVFGFIWAYHAAVLRADDAQAQLLGGQLAVRRLYLYLAAALGLGAVLVGLGGLLTVLIRWPYESDQREPLAVVSAVLLAGLPVWALAWRAVQAAAHASAAERHSSLRRGYLYFFMLLAVLGVLTSTVFVVARLINLMLAVNTQDLLPGTAQAVGYGLLSASLWLVQQRLLAADRAAQDALALTALAGQRATLLLPAGDAFTQALQSALQAAHPGLQVLVQSPAPGDALPDSGLLLLPATLAARIPAGPRALLLPLPVPGADWVALEPAKEPELLRHAVAAVTQLLAGEPVRPLRGWTVGTFIAVAAGGLLLLALLAIPLVMGITLLLD